MTCGAAVRACLAVGLACGVACDPGAGSIEPPVPDLTAVHPQIVEAVEAARAEVVREPRSAEAWGRLGDRYRAHLWDAEAGLCYEQAARLDPSRFVWPYLAAVSFVPSDPSRAAAHFADAFERDDGYAVGHVRYARTLVALGRTDEARAHFLRAAELDPDDAHAALGLGQRAIAAGTLEEARTWLERAVANDPRYAEARYALSQAYLALGDAESAKREAEAAAALPEKTELMDPRAARVVPPAGPTAHYSWALAHEARGDLEAAENAFRESIALEGERPTVRHRFGKLLERLGKFEEAELQQRESIRIKPLNPPARLALGTLLAQRGAFDEAAAELERALEQDPDLTEARFTLGVIHMRAGRAVPAIEQLRAATEREPYRAAYHVNLGMALLNAGRRAEARRRFEQAMSLNPRIPGATLGLGDDRLLDGDAAGALEHYRRALDLQPGWHEAHRRIAWVRATARRAADRDGAEAVEHARQACRVTGHRHAESLDALAVALAESGAFADASETARLAIDLAETEKRGALARAIRARLSRFESGAPFRDVTALPR